MDRGGDSLDEKNIEQFVKNLDADNNGEISADEVENWMKANEGHKEKFGSAENILDALKGFFTPKAETAADDTIAAMAYEKGSELSEVDNKLTQHLKDNIEWIGGKKGEELTSTHLADFLTHIDGEDGDGLITRSEVQDWLEKNNHGDKFGSVDDVFNMLKDLMKADSSIYKAKSYDDYAQDVSQATKDAQETWLDDDPNNDKIATLSIYDEDTNPKDVKKEHKAEVYKQTVNLFSENELKRMDTSGDDVVTKEEYVQYSGGDEIFEKWFDNIDTNKDGKLQKEELAATYSLQDWQNGALEDIENPNQYNGEFLFGQTPDFGDENVAQQLIQEQDVVGKSE